MFAMMVRMSLRDFQDFASLNTRRSRKDLEEIDINFTHNFEASKGRIMLNDLVYVMECRVQKLF